MTQLSAKMYCSGSARTGEFYRLPTGQNGNMHAKPALQLRTALVTIPKTYQIIRHLGNSRFKYQRVGSKSPNPFGLYDMPNTEWVLDQFTPPPSKPSEELRDNPWCSKYFDPRVVKGGSWDDGARVTEVQQEYSKKHGSNRIHNQRVFGIIQIRLSDLGLFVREKFHP